MKTWIFEVEELKFEVSSVLRGYRVQGRNTVLGFYFGWVFRGVEKLGIFTCSDAGQWIINLSQREGGGTFVNSSTLY